jgi:hypothetical protein
MVLSAGLAVAQTFREDGEHCVFVETIVDRPSYPPCSRAYRGEHPPPGDRRRRTRPRTYAAGDRQDKPATQPWGRTPN